MAPRAEQKQLRPETPTRALLRRVQRRSSAGGVNMPPPLPTKRDSIASSKLHQETKEEQQQKKKKKPEAMESSSSQEADVKWQEEESSESLMEQIDQMNRRIDTKDAHIADLEAQLREVQLRGATEKSASSSQNGLTRAAALKLEREFASQERILQGLQKDNEAKTIEVEKLRREKKTMADHLARQYGSDDWEAIVFGSTSSSFMMDREARLSLPNLQETMSPKCKSLTSVALTSTPLRYPKSPLARKAKSSEGGAAEASFFSADESIVEPMPSSSFSVAVTGEAQAETASPGLDLAGILSLIESQRLLIKGFERSTALRMIDCEEKIRQAREREEVWDRRLALFQQQTNQAQT